ncbi:unnamed protein product [Ambrosiozyma monospora]|uniref:Unnamed protein product n=1 Tax=Ambrosiozyma monospora TaxID=43982 RepID=A0ACB5UAQ8_AMBMO|nr:unnamed protein product [Ambrosiozyma monospora]
MKIGTPCDVLLAQEFTFTPVVNSAKDIGFDVVSVPLDFAPTTKGGKAELTYADHLSKLLDNWATEQPGKPKPKAFYVIPDGQNPLGFSETLEHKKKVLELADKHDFLIIEDEPYAYLNFQPVTEEPNFELTSKEFIKELGDSYISLDTTGRVLRLESFSKVFAPGVRTGFIVAHKRVIDLITKYTMVSTQTST